MEAVVVLKDTLDAQVLSTLTPIYRVRTTDSISCVCGHYQANMAICHDSIWITLIVCITIFLLTLLAVGIIVYYKSKRFADIATERKENNEAEENLRNYHKAIEIEKEKSRYRERLLNYLELRGKDGEYVAELKSFINDFCPTEPKMNSGKDSQDGSTGKDVE